MKSGPAVNVRVRTSRVLHIVAVVVALSTACLVLCLALAPWQMTGLGAALAVTLVMWWRSVPTAGLRLVLSLDRGITVIDTDGRSRSGNVLARSYVTGFLTTIVWRPHGRRWPRSIAITPWDMTGEERRQLRVWLRLSHPPDRRSEQGELAADAAAREGSAGPS